MEGSPDINGEIFKEHSAGYIYIYIDNYIDPAPEHLQISEIEQWLSGENDVDGYERFKRQLKNVLAHDQSILLDNGTTVDVELRADKFVINSENEVEVGNTELCIFWNYIRDVGIVAENDIPEEFSRFARVILEIMKSLQYVESVIVSRNGQEFSKKSNAFQFVAD